jgi:hypothetical protein
MNIPSWREAQIATARSTELTSAGLSLYARQQAIISNAFRINPFYMFSGVTRQAAEAVRGWTAMFGCGHHMEGRHEVLWV